LSHASTCRRRGTRRAHSRVDGQCSRRCARRRRGLSFRAGTGGSRRPASHRARRDVRGPRVPSGLLEESVGDLPPREAMAFAERMLADRHVLRLEAGLMTTQQGARPRARYRGAFSRAGSAGRVRRGRQGSRRRERPGRRAHRRPPERRADGCAEADNRTGACSHRDRSAGTGKGVVIDAAARAEQIAQCDTLGIAVSGSTAQRLGRDSPALQDRTLTLDALIARVDAGRLAWMRTRRSTLTRLAWLTRRGWSAWPRWSSTPAQSSWSSATASSCRRSRRRHVRQAGCDRPVR